MGRKNKKMMTTNSGEHLLLGEEGECGQEGKLKGNLKIFLFIFHKLSDFTFRNFSFVKYYIHSLVSLLYHTFLK